MNFKITPDFSSKVFHKVAQLAQEDFDLTEKQAQIDLCNGFVDFLEKEANLSPAMALGLIQHICERGAEWSIENSSDKVAAEAVWSEELKLANDKIEELKLLISLEEIGQKEAGVWDTIKGVYNRLPGNIVGNVSEAGKTVKGLVDSGLEYVGNKIQQGARKGVMDDIGSAFGNLGTTLKDWGGKAFGYLKDNMHTIAPLLATGLAGALATKAVGGKDMPWWGAGLGGLAAAGGGKLLMDNTETGRAYKEEARKRISQWFQSGPPQQ
jgi:hypothetical protein